jgi:hypothetical protein
MPLVALDAILKSYREHANWLVLQADDLESGKHQLLSGEGLAVVNMTLDHAAELRHQANNILAQLVAYERLRAKES